MTDRCRKDGCRFKPYSGRLCYQHTKEAAGLVFDPQAGKFVKVGAVRVDTHHSATPLEESGNLFPRTQERADVGLA
jgi:hypothetical protein